jgi:ATP adenylyltransferase
LPLDFCRAYSYSGKVEFPNREMEALWAPWRFEYFERPKSRDFLSEAARASDDAAHLVLARRKNSFLIMNRYPYAAGHLMSVPYRKVAELGELGETETAELFSLVVYGQNLLRKVMKPEGFNIGINIGECAGAGVPNHLHVHIVPRWSGDTNFMPMLSGTRVLSQSLADLYAKLRAAEASPNEN